MAKWPDPGRVKTRLCPPLRPDEAADLARAFLDDTVQGLRGTSGLEWGIAYAPEDAEPEFRRRYPAVPLRLQGKGDLGQRMARIVSETLEEGFDAVLLIGSDAPLLPPALLAEAADPLLAGRADLALIPATDGGYAMIGLRHAPPGFFDAMPWSTERVLSETVRRAEAFGLRVHQTGTVMDCDTPEDLIALLGAMERNRAGFQARAPATASVLGELKNRM